MTLELWELTIAFCTAAGGLALVARQAVAGADTLQLRRLAGDRHMLQRWWSVIADLPGDVLDPPLRRAVGGILRRHLQRAGHVCPGHPALRAQRLQIMWFVRRHRSGQVGSALSRDRAIAALHALLDLLGNAAAGGLVSRARHARAADAVQRHLHTLELLRAQQAEPPNDHLRRMSRALGAGHGLPVGQLPRSSRALPTQ